MKLTFCTSFICLALSLASTSAGAAIIIHDSFAGGGLSLGDTTSINGGFAGFASNQHPNFSTAIEANGSLTLIGDTFTRDAGYGIISNTGFSANQQLVIDWEISSAFLLNQPDADHKDLDKIVMGISRGQNFSDLFTGFEIALENGGSELRVRLHDSHVGFIPDDYVSNVSSGWNGQDAVSVRAIIDPFGFSVSVNTMSAPVIGQWNDQLRNVSYLQQLTNQQTGLSYVFANHFGSDTIFGPPHHYTSIDSITVRNTLDVVAPAGIALLMIGMCALVGVPRRKHAQEPARFLVKPKL